VLDICGSKATHRDVAHEDLAKMNDDDKNIRISVDCQGDVLVKELSSTPSPELLLSMFPEIVQVASSHHVPLMA
jgi:predicted polyphosphate/ATP-dependent NAD kinase